MNDQNSAAPAGDPPGTYTLPNASTVWIPSAPVGASDYCTCRRCPCCGKLVAPYDATPYWPVTTPVWVQPIPTIPPAAPNYTVRVVDQPCAASATFNPVDGEVRMAAGWNGCAAAPQAVWSIFN